MGAKFHVVYTQIFLLNFTVGLVTKIQVKNLTFE